ncbi:MAG: YraN family protein [Xanthomonadaceae bacterium]|nr:YraN family protein [Xanthomonadaceae bacterium]
MTGAAVEAAAARHLASRGLVLLDANVRYVDGELDLVMRDGDTLVFVEVRYRASDDFGGAAASVTPAKQRRLVRAATRYLASHPSLAALPCRFDVVGAEGDADAPTLTWLRAAFDAG